MIFGEGMYRYRVVEDWGKLPEGWDFTEKGSGLYFGIKIMPQVIQFFMQARIVSDLFLKRDELSTQCGKIPSKILCYLL